MHNTALELPYEDGETFGIEQGEKKKQLVIVKEMLGKELDILMK